MPQITQRAWIQFEYYSSDYASPSQLHHKGKNDLVESYWQGDFLMLSSKTGYWVEVDEEESKLCE